MIKRTSKQYTENFLSSKPDWNILENEHIRQGIKEFSEWPTIPQLYIKKEFVGGCDIVKEMYENGELKKILEKKQINFKK